MRTSSILALGASLATASAQVYQGFNYGSIFTNNAPITEQDYEREFNTAKQLAGTNGGFTSARLFTTIQAGTTNSPTEAIPAASATQTKLLLGIFLSSTDEAFNNELTALRSAITQYGQELVNLVIGISVGSEDLYRISPTGIENRSNPGEGPDAVVRRINAVKQALAGTILSGKPVGHVDTWTAYVNSSNSAVIEASDFVGVDAYPYFQTTQANSIENGESLFFDAYNATVAVSGGKPVWITETGWPVSGPLSGQAVANLENAKTYWDQVGCRVFGQINTFWYTLQDAFPNAPSPSFGIVGSTLSTTPLYDLTCPAGSSSSPPSRGTSSSSAAGGSSQATGPSTTPIGGVSSATPSATSSGSTENPPSQDSGSNSGSPGSSTGSPGSNNGSPGSNSGSSGSTAVQDTVGPSVKTVMTYTTVTTCPVTYTSGSETKTSVTTSKVAVTSTHGTTLATVATPPTAPSPSATPGSCSASLAGDFQFPHLIVPVDKNQPDAALGTSFNGRVSPTVSSIFNFDFPTTYSGKTCSLVFLFPKREQLQTSNYTLSGTGDINVDLLDGPADSATSYNNQPAVNATVSPFGVISDLQAGNSYVIASGGCPTGERIAYKLSSTGGLDLDYFQDFNPEPIGLYIVAC
ncbi:MAG: hypothetical protein Q9166_004007 [cf. Caloplaca sp. 2 TL-2023]